MRIEIFVVMTKLNEKIFAPAKTAPNLLEEVKAYCEPQEILETKRLKVIRSEIVHEFGGMTEIPNCRGFWEDASQIYDDDTKLWLIYTNSSDAREIIEAYAKRIKILTYQKVQAFTIDGKMYYI